METITRPKIWDKFGVCHIGIVNSKLPTDFLRIQGLGINTFTKFSPEHSRKLWGMVRLPGRTNDHVICQGLSLGHDRCEFFDPFTSRTPGHDVICSRTDKENKFPSKLNGQSFQRFFAQSAE